MMRDQDKVVFRAAKGKLVVYVTDYTSERL